MNYGIQIGDKVEWREPSELNSIYRGTVIAIHREWAWVETDKGPLHSPWLGLLNKVEV